MYFLATKRLVYPVEFKLQCIEEAKRSSNQSVAKAHGIHESSIRKWRQQEHIILAQKTRVSYPVDFKLQCIEEAKHSTNTAVALAHGINESMVRKWRQQESNLREAQKKKFM